MSGFEYLWSVPVPTRLSASALPAIVDWCRARHVSRPMLVGGPSLTATPQALALIHGLEATGLAVRVFDRAGTPSLATVAEAVAGYHFEDCQAVIAIGGAVSMDVAKGAVLMAAQRSPYGALADEPGADGDPVDTSALAPLLVVPATVAAALAVGAVVWIADEVGAARPVRHPALRPSEAVLADDLVNAVPEEVQARSAALAALVAGDAGCTVAEVEGLLRPGGSTTGRMRTALELAATVEGARGLRRRLALTAAVAGGLDFALTLSALMGETAWISDIRGRLGGGASDPALPGANLVRTARAACGTGDLGAFDAMLAGQGIAVPEGPRRRGRRGRAA